MTRRRRVMNAAALDDGAYANVAVATDDLTHVARCAIASRPAQRTLCGRRVATQKRDTADMRCVVCAARLSGRSLAAFVVRRLLGLEG